MKLPPFKISYDIDYGMNHRRGWSVSVRGGQVVQFEKHLLTALIKTYWRTRQWRYE